jgi:hypothetical protein
VQASRNTQDIVRQAIWSDEWTGNVIEKVGRAVVNVPDGIKPETIMYFCYGPQPLYDQTIYSILSLLHVTAVSSLNARVVVYCDRPDAFVKLPVETIEVDQRQLDAWLGGSDYIHRRKTCAIIDALQRFAGKVMFLDSDTYWIGSPETIFRRIGPDRACFHLKEGYLRSTGTPFDNALTRQLESHRYRIGSDALVEVDRTTIMWNTGVVGVDASNLGLMNDALALSDEIWDEADPDGAYGKKIHHAEQFAMGYAFRNCRLSEADDAVYHYWPSAAKASFAQLLPDLVEAGVNDQSPESLRRIYAARFRDVGFQATKERLKMGVRRGCISLGIPVNGVRRSA